MKGELHIPDLPEVPVVLSPLNAPVDDPQRVRPSWPARMREMLVGYLPLMLMVGLALGTWLVAKNTLIFVFASIARVTKRVPRINAAIAGRNRSSTSTWPTTASGLT